MANQTETVGQPTDLNAFVPTIIPALQSSAYILVLVGGIVAWSSRQFFARALTQHLDLMKSLQENLDQAHETAAAQAKNHDVLLRLLAASDPDKAKAAIAAADLAAETRAAAVVAKPPVLTEEQPASLAQRIPAAEVFVEKISEFTGSKGDS